MRVLLFERSRSAQSSADSAEDSRTWALRASDIIELLPVVRWRAVEGGPPWALGVFERQGTLVPLVDLPHLLGEPATSPSLGARIALVRLASGQAGSHGRDAVGFLLANTAGLAEIDFDGARAHPGFDRAEVTPYGPIAKTDRGYVQLIEVERAFGRAEREALVPSCRTEPPS